MIENDGKHACLPASMKAWCNGCLHSPTVTCNGPELPRYGSSALAN